MIIPTKSENIDRSIIVIGSMIIETLKKGARDFDSLYKSIDKRKNISISRFNNVITFLWICEILNKNGIVISLSDKKTNVP